MKSFEPLMLITPAGTPEEVEQLTRTFLEAGGRWVQLRQKAMDKAVLTSLAERLLSCCRAHSAVLLINDDPEVALQSGAHGVHLGQSDCPVREARYLLGKDKIIGGTANTLKQMETLVYEGVDYIGLGPFRFTSTKERLSPLLGADGYRARMDAFRAAGYATPVVAIGGIVPDDAAVLLDVGVDGIAVSGALLDDTAGQTRKFLNVLTKK